MSDIQEGFNRFIQRLHDLPEDTGTVGEPWKSEPDSLSFVHNGRKCWVWRHPSLLHLCGYVEIAPSEVKEGIWDYDYAVHGGITRGAGPLHWDESASFIGFDCAHCGDLSPNILRLLLKHNHGTYRTMNYVEAECRSLADQMGPLSKEIT